MDLADLTMTMEMDLGDEDQTEVMEKASDNLKDEEEESVVNEKFFDIEEENDENSTPRKSPGGKSKSPSFRKSRNGGKGEGSHHGSGRRKSGPKRSVLSVSKTPITSHSRLGSGGGNDGDGGGGSSMMVTSARTLMTPILGLFSPRVDNAQRGGGGGGGEEEEEEEDEEGDEGCNQQ